LPTLFNLITRRLEEFQPLKEKEGTTLKELTNRHAEIFLEELKSIDDVLQIIF